MTLTAQAVVDSLATHAAAVRRQRNSLSRVHKLPTELLTDIFEITLNLTLDGTFEDLLTSRYQRLLKLSSVSTAWNNVINHTPALWSIVDEYCPKRLLPTILQRSGKYPLEITSTSMPESVVYSEFHIQMTNHMRRWRTARITVVDGQELPPAALHGPAPLLETLELAVMSPLADDPVLELRPDSFPKLCHIRLIGVPVRDWRFSGFTGLRSLTIGNTLPSGPSSQEILEILGMNPRTETVHIYGLRETSGALSAAGRPPIVLGRLRTLVLQSLLPPHFDALLQSIHAPACSCIRIGCSYPNRPTTFTLGLSLQPFITILTPSLLTSSELVLRLGPSTVSFGTRRARFSGSFDLRLAGIAPLRPLEWLIAAFKHVLAVKPITVDLEEDFDAADEAHRSLLWSLDSMAVLNVKLGVLGIDELLADLAKQTSTGDGTYKWAVPHLRKLIIETSYFNAFGMLRMVESRYGRGSSGGRVGIPVPFERLAFPSLTANVLEEVRNIVGRGNVSCGRLYSDDEGDDSDSEADLASDEEVRIYLDTFLERIGILTRLFSHV